jgi:hypothetical protein
MNSIFKKTLIAAAVVATASANAGTITTGGFSSAYITGADYPLISAEGFDIAESIDIGAGSGEIDVIFTAGSNAQYDEETTLVFTISGAQASTSDTPTLTNTDTAGSSDFTWLSTENDADTNTATITFRLDSAGTVAEAGESFALDDLTLSGITGAVSVSSSGFFGATVTPFDAAASNVVAYLASEYSVVAGTALNGVIDVEEERKEFTGGTTDAFTIDAEFGADLLGTTSTGATLTFTGSDLSFMRDGDGDLDSGTYALTGTSVSEDEDETTLSDDNTTFTISTTAGLTSGDDNLGLTLTVDGADDDDAEVLAAQSFSAAVELGYSYTVGSTTSTDEITVSGLSAGAWALSGATVNIPFMPFGSGISQIIHITNDGSVTGEIELTAIDDAGESYGPVTLNVSAAAGTVTRLNGAIQTALTDAGFDGAGNVDMTLTVNSPKADIEVFAAYNVRGDRIQVGLFTD